MAKDLYKQLGVDKDTAKPGDLLSASKKGIMMKKPKHKKAEKETKKEGKGESKMMEKREMVKMMKHKKPKLGTGKRFAQLTKKLAGKGAKNPKALAAFIGRKKFGAKKFAQLGSKGKK